MRLISAVHVRDFLCPTDKRNRALIPVCSDLIKKEHTNMTSVCTFEVVT